MKRLKDLVTEWPPTNFSGFYSKGDKLNAGKNEAIITEVSMINENIDVTVISNNTKSSATLTLFDASDCKVIYEALKSAIGSTLKEAGELLI